MENYERDWDASSGNMRNIVWGKWRVGFDSHLSDFFFVNTNKKIYFYFNTLYLVFNISYRNFFFPKKNKNILLSIK